MTGHIPVMLEDVVKALEPRDGGLYVDGTFGRGGYTEAILNAAANKVFGIDRDPAAITFGAELSQRYPGRLELLEGRFGCLELLMASAGVRAVQGITLDLGVSSIQLDEAARGFSFRFDAPLDMRMGRDGPNAADIVNETGERELADLINQLGEERRARRIAKAIVLARDEKPILTTHRLADIVRSIVRKSADGIDPATRTFMALRIRVNDELGELKRGLTAAENILAPGGRLAVVSFHSLEDRIVKEFLKSRSGQGDRGSRHLPAFPGADWPPSFRMIARGVYKPSAPEMARNPRSRSAKLRVAERTDAPSWSSAAGQLH